MINLRNIMRISCRSLAIGFAGFSALFNHIPAHPKDMTVVVVTFHKSEPVDSGVIQINDAVRKEIGRTGSDGRWTSTINCETDSKITVVPKETPPYLPTRQTYPCSGKVSFALEKQK